MRVEQLGEGSPEIAVVGGIHGDEPCGVRAVERILAGDPDLERPVKFVVANEAAHERGARYLDEDLNRAFPGDPDGDTHESRLAARLEEELAGCTVLALHSTQSYRGTFAVVAELGTFEGRICPRLSVDAVVETGTSTGGRIFAAAPRSVEVECGYQGSERAAGNAVAVTREFLGATGAVPGWRIDRREGTPVFRLGGAIPKERAAEYEVFASNFELVEAGEAFASAGGEGYVAEEPFYPVLLSPYGYEDVFGYRAERVGVLE